MKSLIRPVFYYLALEDISEEKRKFHSLNKFIFSSEKFSLLALESFFKLRASNSTQNLSNPNETPPFAMFVSKNNYRKLKRNYSSKSEKMTSYPNYLTSISRIKRDIVVNISFILWAYPDQEAFKTKISKEQSFKQKFWTTLLEIIKELIESEPVALTKADVIKLICETQKILEELKKRCQTLKLVIYEILIGLKKIGRIIHIHSLLTKREEVEESKFKRFQLQQPNLSELPEISNFRKFYQKLKHFESSQRMPPVNKKDQIKEYWKWKLRNWKEEKKRDRMKNMKEVHIRCKICLTDIICTIFREHSELCKEKAFLSSTINRMKKAAPKFVSLFQEIRIYLLTKTKMDIKNLRNLKSRFEMSSNNLLLKSQTIVPLDSMKFIDLESANHENESIDDGCSLDMAESLDPQYLRKTHSLIHPEITESQTVPYINLKELPIKECIIEAESRNISPNFNSTPSSTHSNNRPAQHQLSKMSDFAKKLGNDGIIMTESITMARGEKTQNKGYFDEYPKQNKFSPGLKESKFKALRKNDKSNCVDEIEESELLRRTTNEEKPEGKSALLSPVLKDNLYEDVLKKNLQKQKGEVLSQLKEKNESFIEFYSDANFNSSLPSENSSPKLASPVVLNFDINGKRKGSFESSVDPIDTIYEKPSVENTPFTESSMIQENLKQIPEFNSTHGFLLERKMDPESNLLIGKRKDKLSEGTKNFFDKQRKNEEKRSESNELIESHNRFLREERKTQNLEKTIVEKRNQEKIQNKFMSDSEDSIFNEEEMSKCKEKSKEKPLQNFEAKEKFTLRNRTKTLLVIGTKQTEKNKNIDGMKHKHLTDMLSSESLNPLEKMKAQKEIYKKQKKLIKKNDDGIQACILFSELFTYILENDYNERIGLKIQKVFVKFCEILDILPEKKVDEKHGLEDAQHFLKEYQATGDEFLRISFSLYRLQADLLKGNDQKVQRENMRKSFIKRDKKQNSESVEVSKRNRFLEKPDKINTAKNKPTIRSSFTKCFRDSLQSASILSSSKSGHNTPNNTNAMFKFSEPFRQREEPKRKSSALTSQNLEKLEIDSALIKPAASNTYSNRTQQEGKEEFRFSKQTSQVSIQRNLGSMSLVAETDKQNEKEGGFDEEPHKEVQKTVEKTLPMVESKEQTEFQDLQSSQLIIEEKLEESTREKDIEIKPLVIRSIRRNKTYNEIEFRFNEKNNKRRENNKDKEGSQNSSKYMAAINLLKKNNKLENLPHHNYEQKRHNIKKKRNHGVKKSVLQGVVRRSSVDVLSPLTSPETMIKSTEKKKAKKGQIFSADHSPELKVKAEENQLGEVIPTQNTIFSNQSKNDINLHAMVKNDMNTSSHSKILLEKFEKGEIASSSSISQEEESFVLQEEDYFKGYYSDSYMPSQHVSLMELDKKEKGEIGIDNFEFINLIGKGAFGRVYLVRRKQTGDQYAMKIINTMDNMNKNKYLSLKNESKVFDLVYSDFVVKALFKFSHEKFFCFVMEYMYGGDFNKILQKYQSLDNRTARFYIAELVLAVEHLHNLGIVHRDLKPDNILLDMKGHIKLTDFGLSEVAIATLTKHKQPPTLSREEKFRNLIEKLKINEDFIIDRNINYKLDMIKTQVEAKKAEEEHEVESPSNLKKSIKKVNKNMHRIIGTPDYIAPEIINGTGSLNHPCIDWWSVGVILFEFLTGIPPFNDDTPEKIFENISNLRVEWDQISIGYEEDQMTPQAADLIKRLLTLDPEKRLGSKNVDEIKNHMFFQGINWNYLIKSEPPIIPEIVVEEEKKNKDEIAEKDPFLKQVVSSQNNVPHKNEEKRKYFEEDEECQIRYDLLEKENQITLEENFLKMGDKTINEESNSSVSVSMKEKDTKKSKMIMSDLMTNQSLND